MRLGRAKVRRLNRLGPLAKLNANLRTQAETDALWQEFLASAEAAGVHVESGYIRTSTPFSETYHHMVRSASNPHVAMEDTIFVRVMYYHETGRIEFTGYFS
jgi:hypothetical protein